MSDYTSKKLFIINPISGGKDKTQLPDLIKRTLKDSDFELAYTERPEHATELTTEGIKNGFTDFIAVGGDGTVNEVAKALINSDFNLGILPQGSGNGLARHNKIPLELATAIRLLDKPEVKRIDTCSLNNLPFINMSGVGFDAHIGKLFAENKSSKRGFSTYFNTTINEFKNYKSQQYTITINGKRVNKDAFLISFANSSQYGNNAYIAPKASMTDGLMDICIMKPFPTINVLSLGFKLFTKTLETSQYFETLRASEIVVEREREGEIHVDGEPFESGKTLNVKVIPRSLNLLISSN